MYDFERGEHEEMAIQMKVWEESFANLMRSVTDSYRSFIPSDRGEPLDDQIFPWSVEGVRHDTHEQLPLHEGDPLTYQSVMQMMAVEAQHWAEYHAYETWTMDPEMKSLFGRIARAEHIHHLRLMSLLPTPHASSEAVLAAETSLLAVYTMCMENEPDEAIRNAYRHIFADHLQHAEYAADLVRTAGCPADWYIGSADLSGGRPLDQQFMKPQDTIWQGAWQGCYDKNTADPRTAVNLDMAIACEVSAWSGYMYAVHMEQDQDQRMHYGAFSSIEDQHVSILDSIKDPSESMIERALIHEQVEMQNYARLMESETNDQVRKVFAELYREDMQHAWLFGQLMHG